MEKLFEDERDKVRELLQPIERVTLKTDTWTTTNNVAIFGITIHWNDDMWRLHEQVLVVEELGVSHQGIILAEVVHHVLEEYDLTQKVSKMNFTFLIFNFTSINMIFFSRFLLSQQIILAITRQWLQASKIYYVRVDRHSPGNSMCHVWLMFST